MMKLCEAHSNMAQEFLQAMDLWSHVEGVNPVTQYMEDFANGTLGTKEGSFNPLTLYIVEFVKQLDGMFPGMLPTLSGAPRDVCVVCVLDKTFWGHYDGRTCGNPGCNLKVAKGDRPWSKTFHEVAAAAVIATARERGILPPVQ